MFRNLLWQNVGGRAVYTHCESLKTQSHVWVKLPNSITRSEGKNVHVSQSPVAECWAQGKIHTLRVIKNTVARLGETTKIDRHSDTTRDINHPLSSKARSCFTSFRHRRLCSCSVFRASQGILQRSFSCVLPTVPAAHRPHSEVDAHELGRSSLLHFLRPSSTTTASLPPLLARSFLRLTALCISTYL